MQDSHLDRRVLPLFGDRRPYQNAAESELDNRLRYIAVPVLNFDLMNPFAALLRHLIGNGVFTVTSTAVNAGTEQKVRARIVRLAKQLVNVAAAITNVHTSRRIVQQRSRLPQIVDPAHTLLPLDRHAGRVDVPLECGTAFELLAGPKLDSPQSQRQTFRRYRQARVHQNAAYLMVARARYCSNVTRGQMPDLPAVFPMKSEFSGVMKNEHVTVGRSNTIACRTEVSRQNFRFAYPIVIEKSVGRLRVRPVLACEQNRSAWTRRQLFEQRPKPLPESCIFEIAIGQLAINPSARVICTDNSRPSAPLHVLFRHAAPCLKHTDNLYLKFSKHMQQIFVTD